MTQKATIICVDDERTILDALKEQLNRYFKREFIIECAENGEKALELFKELSEDKLEIPVVISDHIMPGMKGDELLKRIYQIDPRIKKILLTGQADADAVGRAVNSASLYRYISKPWEQNDLALTIQEAIRSYYQDKTLEQQNEKLKLINQDLTNLNVKLEQKIDLFNKFVPSQFLNILQIDLDRTAASNIAKGEEYIELSQCAERELTVMFADIRSFTTICEGLSSSQAFEFINNYLIELGPVIRQHHGFIDKFIGDAIMALFQNAEDAVLAGIAMHQRLAAFNKRLELSGQKPIAIGIGINTDTVMLGTLGEENRLQTTVIGDAVNLSQRTETKSKEFSTQLVVTENTYNKIKHNDSFILRFIDRSRVKGKHVLLNFYEVLNLFDQDLQKKKIEVSELYEKGVTAFHNQDFEEALKCFAECLKIYPEDKASLLYQSRAKQAIQEKELVNQRDFVDKDLSVINPALTRYFKFWGTRGSAPVAGVEYKKYGGCTSCLEIRNNGDLIIFDAGSGIRKLGEQLINGELRTVHLIISHFHWDHIWGFPFFVPAFCKGFTIHIYAPGTPEEIKEQFLTLLNPNFFPIGFSDLKANIIFHTLTQEYPIIIGDVNIFACKAYHPGETFCYRIESPGLTIGYATDNEFLKGHMGTVNDTTLHDIELKDPNQQVQFFKGCDLMIHEAQYSVEEYEKKTGWGHSSLGNAVMLINQVQPKEWIISHHDPHDTDEILIQKLKAIQSLLDENNVHCQIEMAADGLYRGF